MTFPISEAYAETAAAPTPAPAPAAQEPGVAGLIFPLAVLVVFFFLFIRPQQRRQKEHKQMVEALVRGTDVVTTGGMLGRVVDLDDNFVRLEVADNVHIQVQRHAISSLMPKGTYRVSKKI